MGYSEALDKRLLEKLEGRGVTRKKMFGGLCYLRRGNMLCGVLDDALILRLGEKEAERALAAGRARVFDLTGKAMKGWIMVDAPDYAGNKLDRWLELAFSFGDTLPEK